MPHAFLSFTDLFKIGVGPSSSHTMGPMIAAARFRGLLAGAGVARIEARLLGSLAFTGRGHATDRAVVLGLLGFIPATLDAEAAERALADLGKSGRLALGDGGSIDFDRTRDIVFDYETDAVGHPNAMTIRAFAADGRPCLERTYLSIGGGFIRDTVEAEPADAFSNPDIPFAFASAAQMLSLAEKTGSSIAKMQRAQ